MYHRDVSECHLTMLERHSGLLKADQLVVGSVHVDFRKKSDHHVGSERVGRVLIPSRLMK